jgi:hypothetical protein
MKRGQKDPSCSHAARVCFSPSSFRARPSPPLQSFATELTKSDPEEKPSGPKKTKSASFFSGPSFCCFQPFRGSGSSRGGFPPPADKCAVSTLDDSRDKPSPDAARVKRYRRPKIPPSSPGFSLPPPPPGQSDLFTLLRTSAPFPSGRTDYSTPMFSAIIVRAACPPWRDPRSTGKWRGPAWVASDSSPWPHARQTGPCQ